MTRDELAKRMETQMPGRWEQHSIVLDHMPPDLSDEEQLDYIAMGLLWEEWREGEVR